MTREEAMKILSDENLSLVCEAIDFAIDGFLITGRKKAKWIKCENPMYCPFDGSDEYTYQCSICHMKNDKSTKYCPNCGAHMIG